MQYTLESGEFLRFGIQANTESYTSCKVRQKADHDASNSFKTLLTAVKANRTLLCEGKLDEQSERPRVVVRANS